MLPIKNRLVKNEEFERIFSKGRSVSSHPVFLKFQKNSLNVTRFGISAGLKFSKKATKRNAIKRKIRAYLKENMDYFKSGFDVIIIPRGEQKKEAFNWNEELGKAFKKANLISVKE